MLPRFFASVLHGSFVDKYSAFDSLLARVLPLLAREHVSVRVLRFRVGVWAFASGSCGVCVG